MRPALVFIFSQELHLADKKSLDIFLEWIIIGMDYNMFSQSNRYVNNYFERRLNCGRSGNETLPDVAAWSDTPIYQLPYVKRNRNRSLPGSGRHTTSAERNGRL